MAWLCAHAFEPPGNGRKVAQIEAALARTMRISVERNVGDGIRVSSEPIVALEVCFHHGKCGIPFRVPLRNKTLFLLKVILRRVVEPEPRHRDIRFVTVLFEEHPGEGLPPAPSIRR